MKGNLWLVNLLLLAGIGGVSWQLRQNWMAAQQREQALLAQRPKAAEAPKPLALTPTAPVKPVSYMDMVQHVLFSKDRNPNVIPDPPKPAPPPPPWPALPAAYGFMDFGGGPTIILSDNGGPQKSYHKGDKIGALTITDLTRNEIEFEFDGRKQRKHFDELQAKNDAPQQQQGTQHAAAAAEPGHTPGGSAAYTPPPPEAPKPETKTLASESTSGPFGPVTGDTTRACQPSDSSPAGTVVEGYRKVMQPTPFGTRCSWEASK